LLPMGDILNFPPRLKAEAPGKGCHLDEFGREPIWLLLQACSWGNKNQNTKEPAELQL
jgi:hypothetical protein